MDISTLVKPSVMNFFTETVVQDERTVFSIKNLLLRMAMIDSRIDEVREKTVTCPYWIDCSSESEDTKSLNRISIISFISRRAPILTLRFFSK